MPAQKQLKTHDKTSQVSLREGYQPTGDKVDLSRIKPPKQETAAQKPKNSSK